MTDTVSCENCGTALPGGAVFCTNCGAKVAASAAGGTGSSAVPPPPPAFDDDTRVVSAAPTAPAAADDDPTRVVTPGLHDATQILPEPPRAPAPPAQDATRVSPSPAAAAPAEAPQSPWQPPPTAAPGPGAWQPPPPPAPDWAQSPQAAPPPGPAWTPPPAPTAPPGQWQQPPPAQWTPAGATPVAARRRAAGLAAALAFIGAILLVVGVFTPWLQSTKGASVKLTGWEMATKKTSSRPFDSPDPAILLGIAAAALAIGAMLVAGVAKALMRILLAAAGIGAAVVLVRDYLSIKDTVKHNFTSGTTIDFQYGFWLAAAGAVVLLIAALAPSRKRT
jgi:uncharacterized membrane protein YphA (DoxX/SURF4 family)